MKKIMSTDRINHIEFVVAKAEWFRQFYEAILLQELPCGSDGKGICKTLARINFCAGIKRQSNYLLSSLDSASRFANVPVSPPDLAMLMSGEEGITYPSFGQDWIISIVD
ncbi:hypothetical protein [Roseinatronobacter sp. NSM]|uniref:hypothetical protein n=1 Tax=Roseinatronobacter sp. NSM TaxID=3457785 RepID=UPI004036DBB0